jgi:ribosomal-protein-alanine N-acetyltransferase
MIDLKEIDNLSFRFASKDDLAQIMLINNQFEHNWTEDKFIEVLDNNITVLLACFDEKCVGYVIYFYVLDEVRIVNIAISKEYQNQSIGKHLLHKSLENSYNDNIQYALLDVKTDNYVAINMYTKFGFQILARRLGYYSGDVEGDAYFMQLKL